MSMRILLCDDGSTFALGARGVALQLASTVRGAQLTVLHVVNVKRSTGNLVKDLPGHLGFEPAVVGSDELATRQRAAEDLLAEVAREAEIAGVTPHTVVDQGAVAERIAHHARHVDLVIMGLRGTTEDDYPGQGGANLDSVLNRLLVPVLFVGKTHRRITGFALGYDGSDGAARALKATALVAGPLDVPVHTMYISSDGTGGEVLDECSELFPGLELIPHQITSDDAHTAMAEQAVRLDVNVLSVGFRGRSRLKNFLYGTTAEYILMSTDLMVLVAH